MKRPQPRSAFGWIFLAFGLGIFYVLAATSISSELNDVLHGPPLTEPVRKFTREKLPVVEKVIKAILPWDEVGQMPHVKKVSEMTTGKKPQSTNDDPFQQFNVVLWLGWAFVISALAEVGVAYLRSQKTQVAE